MLYWYKSTTGTIVQVLTREDHQLFEAKSHEIADMSARDLIDADIKEFSFSGNAGSAQVISASLSSLSSLSMPLSEHMCFVCYVIE